jgi:hypothetical protein
MEKRLLTNADVRMLGSAIGQAMGQANADYSNQRLPQHMKEASLTLGTTSIYGRNSIFDPCSTGDIFGLQVATHGLMNWLGWRSNRFYRRRVDFMTFWGIKDTHGVSGAAVPATATGSPCADPTTWEYGTCGYDQIHTSWYHLGGDALDPHTIVQDRCETTPKYRLNGIQISDDVEWQMNGIMNVLAQSIDRDVVHGSHDNSNQMNGLESIIKTGYAGDNGVACPQVDSIIVDWAHDNLDGEDNDLGNFFEYLDEVVTEIEYRASQLGGIAENDMILLTSRFMATCLLDSYSCYTICGVTDLQTVSEVAMRAEARKLRRDLNGGPLYDGRNAVGYLQLKSGRRLPIIVDDSMDIDKPNNAMYCTDVYVLSRQIGSTSVLYGEYLDMRTYENRVKAQMPGFTARADAAGRFVTKGKEDNWCIQLIMGTSPELYLAAPWAQVRIENVCCSRKRQPISGDPFQPDYMPGGRPLHVAGVDYQQA